MTGNQSIHEMEQRVFVLEAMPDRGQADEDELEDLYMLIEEEFNKK